jgi:zinc finger HIT domain-containing protein 3
LTSIDKLRGRDREEALQRALGVAVPDIIAQGSIKAPEDNEDVLALRELTEAVEAAVRGSKQDALGLDWGD